MLYAGGGVITSGAAPELLELSEKTHILVATTLLGKGAIPETHPHSLGMLGMHGTAYANYAVAHCDLLIAVGARFDDRVTGKLDAFAQKAKVIHIDIDPAEIGKTVHVDIPIVGDCKLVLHELLKQVEPREETDWNKQIMQWKKEYPLHYGEDGLYPQYVIEKIWEATKGEAIVVTDVGQHQMWSALFYKCKYPRQFLSSGGLGTMGYGLPGGHRRAGRLPGQDGLRHRGRRQLPDEHPGADDRRREQDAGQGRDPEQPAILGMVRQWQELFWNKRYSGVDMSAQPDFVKLAEAYGAVGMRIDKKEDVEEAIREGARDHRPAGDHGLPRRARRRTCSR